MLLGSSKPFGCQPGNGFRRLLLPPTSALDCQLKALCRDLAREVVSRWPSVAGAVEGDVGFLFVLVFQCLHVNTERTMSSKRTRLVANEDLVMEGIGEGWGVP